MVNEFHEVFTMLLLPLPLETGVAFHFSKLEFHSLKDACHQVWLKWAQWFWRIGFLKVVNVFLDVTIISPFGNGSNLSFEEILKDAMQQV